MSLSKPVQALLRTWSRIAPDERGSYRLVRGLRRFIPKDQWASEYTLPGGIRMTLNLAEYPDCCMAFGLYELSLAKVLKQTLKTGDHFIDGGANIGYFTMMAAHLVGPSGRVDAFEPEPSNRARLLEHLERNGLTQRVNVHPVALSNQDGQATIYKPQFTGGGSGNHGSSSLFDPGEGDTTATPVPTVRMDEHLAGTSPKLIKLDLEGAEPLAIEGAAGLLTSEHPPVLVCEYSPHQSQIAEHTADDVLFKAWSVQPRYTGYLVGAGLKRIDPDNITATVTKQCNVLLQAD